MTKKKICMYCVIFAVFLLLFFLYAWSLIQSTDAVNGQRLDETLRAGELQIQKNLQYHVKELNFSMTQSGLDNAATLEDALKTLSTLNTDTTEYAVVDFDGVLYKADGLAANNRIDSEALKTARAAGYAVLSVPDAASGAQRMDFIVPLESGAPYFLVQSVSVEAYLGIITSDLSLPAEEVTLYDEWGNPVGGGQGEGEAAGRAVNEGAVQYARNHAANAYGKAGMGQVYNLYIPAEQPQGWFVGTQLSYNGANPLGLHFSAFAVLGLLLVVLISMIVLDIVNDRDKKKAIAHSSERDPLTGLLNGVGLREALSAYIQKHSLLGYSFVCMDIFSFSRINTMFGYTTGDELLRALADDIIARQQFGTRVNADCFAFLTKTSDDMLERLENNFRAAIERCLGGEYQQMITFKFGVYPITEAKPQYREIYDGALMAHKSAKKQVSNHQVVYDSKLKKTLELQKNIEINMVHALSKEEFLVYVQPQFEMPSEECTRGETLIRWKSEYMGFLPPDKFIPIFENNGFIVETDFFMLTSALELLQRRLDAGLKPITLAVNQSKVTIAFPNYYERLKATMEQYSVPIEYIELEITESALEDAWDTLVPLIHNIKRLGFSIAMDDFGSGFSSLNTLRILPIDILKIDKEFLRESDNSPRSKTIIRNIVNMAKELDILVVCEGVETEAQLLFLKEIGCNIVQGFYYTKPIPIEEFENLYLN